MKTLTKTVAVLATMGLFQIGAMAADGETGAKLMDAKGKVLVNQGKGLVSGKVGTELKDGDRVVSLDGSSATIKFPDGCEMNLDANKMVVIDHQLGCKAAILSSGSTSTIAGAAAEGSSGLTTAQGLLIGGAWVGAGAVAGTNSNNNSHRSSSTTPISPQ